jgi:Cof subfamily protein (haloacid dehalogenase superfamily)
MTKPSRPVRLLIADVDGTLVTKEKILTERARSAVLRLREAGIRFAVTSGRPPRGMAMLVDPLALDDPVAGFNGGLFVNPDMSVIEQHTLEPAIAKRAVELIDAHGMDAWVYCGNDWFIRDEGRPHVAREAWTVKFPPTVVPDLNGVLDQAVKIVGVSDDYDLVARAEADAQAEFGQRASAARSQPYYLDVTSPLANKGQVVKFLSGRLGIDPEAIATMGDMPNDVLMFRKSGFSIAMGNASPEVQHQASVVTDSYEAEGFAKAVERFLLGEEVPDLKAPTVSAGHR